METNGGSVPGSAEEGIISAILPSCALLSPHRRDGQINLDHRDEAVQSILGLLRKAGAEVLLDAERCKDLSSAKGAPPLSREENLDLLVVIGGDGTIFRAVRELEDFSIPILGINKGGIGFLSGNQHG